MPANIRLHHSLFARLKNKIAFSNFLPSTYLPESVRKYVYNVLAILVVAGIVTFFVGFVGQRRDRVILGLILAVFSGHSITKVVKHFNQLHGQTDLYQQTVDKIAPLFQSTSITFVHSPPKQLQDAVRSLLAANNESIILRNCIIVQGHNMLISSGTVYRNKRKKWMGMQVGFNNTSHGIFYIHSTRNHLSEKHKGKKSLRWLSTVFKENFEDCIPSNYSLIATGKHIILFGKHDFRHPNDVTMAIAKITKKLKMV